MIQPTVVETIKKFLELNTHADLAFLYNPGMECQINVAQDGGERVEKEYKGKKWRGWTDGATTWKSLRIPYKANTEPEYDLDRKMTFDLIHAEAIGMTGWDWLHRVSKWVAFDFDAIVGHSGKHQSALTDDELKEVEEAATNIPWVEIRKSTSGKGLHLYCYLDDIPTANHNEHAALGRAILGQMAALVNFDFYAKVDMCGGNMWVWHRKMKGTDGLTVLKKSTAPTSVPPNWKDHVKVITGKRRKVLPQDIEEKGKEDLFMEMCGQRPYIKLDSEHKKLIDFLKELNALWWWDSDNHMLVTHTGWLKRAYDELDLLGIFETQSPTTDLNEQNCFCFPMRRGAWSVRRYSLGIKEHDSWEQDGRGWTRCYLNRRPDLNIAARSLGGLEDPSGGFIFREAEVALAALEKLGARVEVGTPLRARETKIKQHKDGRIVVEVEYKSNDRADEMPGWLPKGKKWTKILSTPTSDHAEQDVGNYDDIVRHLITTNCEDCGWYVKSGSWTHEPLNHVKAALQSLGIANKEINIIIGSSVMKPWKLVNKPFEPEYTGDREWNRNAAKFRFTPTQELDSLSYPRWQSILDHCGTGLNDSILNSAWAKASGVKTGGDYLKLWIASIFQEPEQPLPYLFLWSMQQGTGKSIFHEALSLLITKGYQRADLALTSTAGFNGELEGAVICVIEEVNLSENRTAHNRIKDWVTAPQLNIRHMYRSPYHIPNTTHWVQCANDYNFCPVFPGDTRVTMVNVPALPLEEMIPKKRLLPMLEKEAPHFLAEVLNLEIPECQDRLNIPVIDTEDKKATASTRMSPVQGFLNAKTKAAPGYWIKFGDLFEGFLKWLMKEDFDNPDNWSKIKFGRAISPMYPKGRNPQNAQFYVGNIAWIDQDISERPKYYLVGDRLEKLL